MVFVYSEQETNLHEWQIQNAKESTLNSTILMQIASSCSLSALL